jgi:hypothetical protein
MPVTDVSPSPSDGHDGPVRGMSWHRRRIRRARRRSRGSAPEPPARVAQASKGRIPSIRRVVVFSPANRGL